MLLGQRRYCRLGCLMLSVKLAVLRLAPWLCRKSSSCRHLLSKLGQPSLELGQLRLMFREALFERI